MQTLLLLCPVPLLFIAFGMMWHSLAGDSGEVCDCEHPCLPALSKRNGIRVIHGARLLFGLLLPDQALGVIWR